MGNCVSHSLIARIICTSDYRNVPNLTKCPKIFLFLHFLVGTEHREHILSGLPPHLLTLCAYAVGFALTLTLTLTLTPCAYAVGFAFTLRLTLPAYADAVRLRCRLCAYAVGFAFTLWLKLTLTITLPADAYALCSRLRLHFTLALYAYALRFTLALYADAVRFTL